MRRHTCESTLTRDLTNAIAAAQALRKKETGQLMLRKGHVREGKL